MTKQVQYLYYLFKYNREFDDFLDYEYQYVSKINLKTKEEKEAFLKSKGYDITKYILVQVKKEVIKWKNY